MRVLTVALVVVGAMVAVGCAPTVPECGLFEDKGVAWCSEPAASGSAAADTAAADTGAAAAVIKCPANDTAAKSSAEVDAMSAFSGDKARFTAKG
ncbi:MAG: hypothetical protein FJ100_24090, partial [Deltaproteobacteria bacterium]|nr:hypothetical protein [Deltaproteobacteria bacterium]